jgi:hypothetical protein
MATVPLRFPKTIGGWAIHIALLSATSIAVTRFNLPVTPRSTAGWLMWLAVLVPLILFGEWVSTVAPNLDKWSSLARIALGVVLGSIACVLFAVIASPILDAAIKR